jgi:hypothetical protein
MSRRRRRRSSRRRIINALIVLGLTDDHVDALIQ